MRTLPRILFLTGMVDEGNTTDLMCQIININAEDDQIMEDAMSDLNTKVQGLTVREMKDGYPVCVALEDGTKLGIGYPDTFYDDARPPIILHIKTSGGYVEHGLALVNMIRTSKTPVHAIVHHGHSMGFIIASACDYRIGFPTTRMMFHDLSSGTSGTGEQMMRMAVESLELRELAFSVVTDNTKLTREDLTKIYEHIDDRYFTGDELLEFGLLDEIEEYSIPEHKQIELMEQSTQEKLNIDKFEDTSDLLYKISKIRTRQMIIDEIYDLMNIHNLETIEHYLEDEDSPHYSKERLEEILTIIKEAD